METLFGVKGSRWKAFTMKDRFICSIGIWMALDSSVCTGICTKQFFSAGQLKQTWNETRSAQMINYIKQIYQPPMTILKHHFWFNFTEHNITPPTWINVMREPLSWFESRFWFDKNGRARKEGARNNRKSNPENIDKCIKHKHKQCTSIIWFYTRFFCGNKIFCTKNDEDSKKKAVEYSKQR